MCAEIEEEWLIYRGMSLKLIVDAVITYIGASNTTIFDPEQNRNIKNLDQNEGPSKQGNWYEQELHTSHVHFSSKSFAAASSASSFAAARCAW